MIGAAAHHPIEAVSVFRRLNFLRVFPADGGQIIRIQQPALEQVDVPEKLQPFGAEQFLGHANALQDRRRKQAVVSHVVDGEDYGNSVKQRVVRILRAQKDRHKRRLPVVAMHHVGRPDVLGNLHRGPAEFAEAFGVVRIIFALLSVELFAVEIGRVVHEVIAHAGKKRTVGHRGKAQPLAHRDRQARHNYRGRLGAAIARQNHGDFVAHRRQRLGQSFDHVGQAAGL